MLACASMTTAYRHSPRKRESTWQGNVLLSPSDPSVKHRFTLTFDSSPIKGEGLLVGVVVLWILDQVQNDGPSHLLIPA